MLDVINMLQISKTFEVGLGHVENSLISVEHENKLMMHYPMCFLQRSWWISSKQILRNGNVSSLPKTQRPRKWLFVSIPLLNNRLWATVRTNTHECLISVAFAILRNEVWAGSSHAGVPQLLQGLVLGPPSYPKNSNIHGCTSVRVFA